MKKKEKPSQTALKVALNIIALSHVDKMKNILPEGIVTTTSELLINSEAISLRRLKKYLSPKILKFYKKFDWMLPGQFEVFGYRKAFFEKNVLDAIQNGVSQVLVLGAGYDTLCYRLSAKYPNIMFFEIDHPVTALRKIDGIIKMGKLNNHHIIPEDLSKKTLSEVLAKNGFWNSKARSIITAEGLLQYLPLKSVKDLFKQCSSNSGKESRVAFTYVGKDPNGKTHAGPNSRLMLWLLKMGGEPWLWATNLTELNELLIEQGWQYSPELTGNKIKRGIEYFACAIKK